MSGFVAIISHDPAGPVGEDDLTALVGDYRRLRGAGEIRTESVGDWARAAAIDGGVPLQVERDEDSWCLVLGQMYAERPLLTARLEDLDGQFAAMRFTPEQGRLEVITDPFGMQDVYVARRGNLTYVSTSALVLATHLRAAPDLLGIELFLRTGVQFGPITHWRDVERVDPATAVCFAPGVAAVREVYWTPEVDEATRNLSLTDTIDRCAEIGVAVLERRMRDGGLISADLTGGFDSRMVTALLDRGKVPFETMTVAEEPVDARLARAVADVAGWRCVAQSLPAGWEIDAGRLQEALGWGDGRLEVLALSEVLWRQKDRSSISRRVVTGGGGENFGPSPWMQELWRAGRSRTVNYDNLMNMRVFLPIDVSVMRQDPRSSAEPYVREVLARRTEGLRGELNTTQLDVIHAYREVGHFGAYRSAGEAHVRAQLPCYYRDFWTAAFSANHRWRNGHRLHRGIIERLHPSVAAVETQRGGPAALTRPGNALRFLPYHARLARTAVRKLRRRPGSGSGMKRAAAVAYVEVVRRLRAEGVLVPGEMRSSRLYDAQALTRKVENAAAGGTEDATMIGRIATVELALLSADASL
jgi:hypothetical protein